MDQKQIFEIKTTNKREDQALRYDLTVSKLEFRNNYFNYYYDVQTTTRF